MREACKLGSHSRSTPNHLRTRKPLKRRIAGNAAYASRAGRAQQKEPCILARHDGQVKIFTLKAVFNSESSPNVDRSKMRSKLENELWELI
jgi:hypothetical protein